MNFTEQTHTQKPERLLRLREVENLVGLRKTTIYAGANQGTFPRPVKLSTRCVAWRESEIAAWQAQRPSTLGGQP